ncbi:MAG: YbaB/EbfC family nucleoid-associated protein [Bauldia sp.]
MPDIFGMMKQAKELQSRMQSLQEEVSALRLEGSAGGGLVSATVSGKGDLVSLKIDPSLMKPGENEMLEDLVVAACGDAKRKAEAAASEKMQALTGGLQLPPGLKLPF